jgi:hypothetical protein
MKKVDKLQSVILILVLMANFTYIVFAQDDNQGVILRPVIEYTSGDLRDPFSDLFQLNAEKERKEKIEQDVLTPEEVVEPQKPLPSLDKLKVQGVIWGGRFPQVIINNKILGIGDSIEEIEIVGIEKKGITLSFAGRTVILPTPGNAPVSKKGDKEEE